jgi:hypothetical protein
MSEMADRLALLCSEVDVSRFKRAAGVDLPSSDHSLFAPANDIDIASVTLHSPSHFLSLTLSYLIPTNE